LGCAFFVVVDSCLVSVVLPESVFLTSFELTSLGAVFFGLGSLIIEQFPLKI